MYCSILPKQYPIFTSLSILDWFKLNMYVFVWISSPPLLTVIILYFETAPCSFWGVKSFMQVHLAFYSEERFHFKDIFGIHWAVPLHDQTSFSSLFDCPKGFSTWNNLLYLENILFFPKIRVQWILKTVASLSVSDLGVFFFNLRKP